MFNRHAGPITQAKLAANRRAKMPTREETEQAMAMFPDNPTKAAIKSLRMASERLAATRKR